MGDYMYWPFTGFEEEEDRMEVELGSIYQIDHSKLTPRTPIPLRSVRLVMVSEKTDWNVSVRYPSIESLKRYFNNKENEIYPEMDQKFVMDRKLAERVLLRRVPSEQFLVKKEKEEFWLVMSKKEKFGDVVSKKAGLCLSELKSSGVPGWGVRRQVKFIGRHREETSTETVVNDEEAEIDQEDEEEENNVEKDEEREQNAKDEIVGIYERPKRKCCMVKSLNVNQNVKKRKLEKKAIINKKAGKSSRQIVLARSPMSTRWSDDRYSQAQQFLLEVMKAQGATYEKPILRPELRAEARKKIGDTGLLDHLLKHMAELVAPGGTERFRRRHNADGAMEYWLESADLVDIRREAGVKDPYWTPPPGWKVGDSPNLDPIYAQELKELKEEISRLNRNMKDMISSRKQMEEELAKVRREMEKLTAKNQKKESQAILAMPTPLNSDSSSTKMEKYYKEQLTILSDNFTRIEGEMVKLKAKVEEKTSSEQALIALPEAFTEKEKTKTQASNKSVIVHPQLEKDKATVVDTEMDPKATASGGATARNGATAAAKAAKIERLKSGFRICKPQGTFLWPNSNSPSNVVVQVEDIAVVPTPPSVSSSTAIVPLQLPPSPVRPTPERRAITLTVSSVSNYSSTTTTTTSSNKTGTWINLNDVPGGIGEGAFCGTVSSRLQAVSNTTNVAPPVIVYGEPKESSSGSCSNKEVGTWLALAAPSESIEDPTRG